ncbi:hypothetical protein NLJ89_g11933 [Agrocybe chaxingu]|uniref:FAD/NAD(P)-binding domain-containing protein n=1 Tax=Agrocybe chaxingu TaxID=84603 RepID=A0A9W8JVT9_9AGAR|nr:hypothetical protein NLJ89_g11933 [Agrocybe chaxingu]
MPPIYDKPTREEYDYIVIGGGSGGSGTARRAASYGKKVALIELTSKPGGTCVNVGCVPKKIMWHAADLHDKISHHTKGYKFNGVENAKFDWKSFKPQRDEYIKRLNGIYANNWDREGIEFHQGFGSFISPTEVQVTLPDNKGTRRTPEHT